jgi:hypothetical protein
MGWGDISGLRGLSGQLPDSIAKLMASTATQVYVGALPTPPAPLTDPQTYKDAYLGAFAVFWLLTSGSGPYAATLSTATPPCTEPSWISGLISGGGSPPSPQQAGLDEGATAFDILLAILALFELLCGDAAGALALVAAALANPVIDWPTAQCNLFWMIDLFANLQLALQDFFTFLALGYPPAFQLGTSTVDANNQPVTKPATDFSGNQQVSALLNSLNSGSGGSTTLTTLASLMPASSGVPLTRTLPNDVFARGSPYPFAVDQRSAIAPAGDLNYFWHPGVSTTAPPDAPDITPLETAATAALIWPSADDGLYAKDVMAEPLNAGGLLANAATPTSSVAFGGTVANALSVVEAALGGRLKEAPDFNLDGDRGYGWRSWSPSADPAVSLPVTPVFEP